jgi:hypothetical protein
MIIENKRYVNAPLKKREEREHQPPEVDVTVNNNGRFQEFLARQRQFKYKMFIFNSVMH